jgi:Ras-related C3 botulinum toxin substrate 1
MTSKSIKCVILGDDKVGKSSILQSYTTDSFYKEYIPTMFDNYSSNLCIEKICYKIDLWDTSGKDDYKMIRHISYPQTDIIILCYSIISPTSFENIYTKWYPEIYQYAHNIPIILVGTKLDLKLKNYITYEQGLLMKNNIGAIGFYECSALTQKNLSKIFKDAIIISQFIEPKKKKKCIIL